MAENSKIQWTHHTFNPWRGCQKVSSGCDNCYAETMSKRNPGTLGVWGPNGTRVVASESQWKLPHKWNREAEAAGERRRVFCASLADVFEDWGGPVVNSKGEGLFEDGHYWFSPDEDCFAMSDPLTLTHIRRRLFEVIDQTPWLDWLLLTKRPENARRMMASAMGYSERMVGIEIDIEEHIERCSPNLWIGTSVENQEQADKRIPELLRVPAAVRFLSMEPLLGPVDLTNVEDSTREKIWVDCLGGVFSRFVRNNLDVPPCGITYDSVVNWVIVGGESGPGARPCDLEWIRSIQDQCKEAGTPVFVKQIGAITVDSRFAESDGTPAFIGGIKDKKGGDPSEWPEDLRVRELPTNAKADRGLA